MAELKTLKSEDVVIRFPKYTNQVKYVVGNLDKFQKHVMEPYSILACDFLHALSKTILHDIEAKQYPDVVSFGYWCRRGNVDSLRKKYNEKNIRLGRGIIFHIAPSNVPVNFAFSFAFSLLSGNSNIVRIPSKAFPQVEIICRIITEVILQAKYNSLAESNLFISYERDDAITAHYSKECDGRIVWGGSQTINSIRKLKIPERSIEVTFADRYSFCVINASELMQCDDTSFDRIVSRFYNDTYLMDQNACSSPHFVLWISEEKIISDVSSLFWSKLAALVQEKYEMEPVMAVDKLTLLYQSVIDQDEINNVDQYGNALYVLSLSSISENLDTLRGLYGHFYQYRTTNINILSQFINQSYQTMTYYGVEKKILVDFVKRNKISGIDRIVPIGSALDISIIWDGYDLVRTLSRIIEIL